jgi:hypothetical protein
LLYIPPPEDCIPELLLVIFPELPDPEPVPDELEPEPEVPVPVLVPEVESLDPLLPELPVLLRGVLQLAIKMASGNTSSTFFIIRIFSIAPP